MKQATFFLLNTPIASGKFSSHEAIACSVAAEHYQMGKCVLLACGDQEQAERLDEALWQCEPSRFIPHNLTGEGPHFGAAKPSLVRIHLYIHPLTAREPAHYVTQLSRLLILTHDGKPDNTAFHDCTAGVQFLFAT